MLVTPKQIVPFISAAYNSWDIYDSILSLFIEDNSSPSISTFKVRIKLRSYENYFLAFSS